MKEARYARNLGNPEQISMLGRKKWQDPASEHNRT